MTCGVRAHYKKRKREHRGAAVGSGLKVLLILERNHLGGAGRAENAPARRALGERALLLGIGEGRAAVVAPVG
jgi:hypothetical protein